VKLPKKKYGLIYADPPWKHRDKAKAGNRGAESKYSVMNLDDLCALPVKDIAADDCLLAMWYSNQMPVEAITLVEAWGFKPKRIVNMNGFTWSKKTKTGKQFFGMGYYTRASIECCLFAVKGSPKIASHSVRQCIEAVPREHSRKPDEARDRLETLVGSKKRIELFAREWKQGWDCWGNEIQVFS